MQGYFSMQYPFFATICSNIIQNWHIFIILSKIIAKNSYFHSRFSALVLWSSWWSFISGRHRYRDATNWLTTRETETPRNGFPLVEARSELAPVGFYFLNPVWINLSFWLFELSFGLFEAFSRYFEFGLRYFVAFHYCRQGSWDRTTFFLFLCFFQ